MEIEEIIQVFSTDEPTAKTILEILNGDHDDVLPKNFPSVKQLKAYLDKPYMRLLAINEVVDLYGVEGIFPSPPDSYASILYVNAGDTYRSTIIYDLEAEEFVIGCWGAFEEQAQLEYE